MTENEAKTENERHIQFLRVNWKPHPDYGVIEALNTAIQALEEIQAYRAIGTVEEFKALKEKSVAKKVNSRGQGHEADCYCPNCNVFLGNDQDFCFSHTNYCNECGQALET